jgi:hypothetical protein
MVKLISVTPSDKPDKKLEVKLQTETGREKNIHIGQKGADDFTKTKSVEQKNRYILRHRKNEDWSQSGILSSGFWAKHLLWNQPTLSASIKDVKERFNL